MCLMCIMGFMIKKNRKKLKKTPQWTVDADAYFTGGP